MMRPPREHVQQQQQQHRRREIHVFFRSVTQQKYRSLPDCKPGSADQRAHRTPLRKKNVQRHRHEKQKAEQQKPRIFAG